MRKPIVFAALLLLASFAFVQSAGAACYECRYAGFVCTGVGWCSETYVCSMTSSFCSICWEVCYERTDSYCGWSSPCQWTEKLPLDNLVPRDSFLSSLIQAPGSCKATS